MTKIHLHDKRKLHIKWFNRLMSIRSNDYLSFIWVHQLSPYGCNDFPIQKCKNQNLSSLHFQPVQLRAWFPENASFNVICDFFIWSFPCHLLLWLSVLRGPTQKYCHIAYSRITQIQGSIHAKWSKNPPLPWVK